MHPTLNTIDIVVSDLDASIAFYACLGVEFKLDEHSPEHAGCDLPNGLHAMLDTEGFRTPFLPGWSAPTGGPRTLPCFESTPRPGWTPRTPSSSRRATGGSPSRSTRSSPTRPTRSPTIRIWRRCTPPPQCAWATAALFVTTGILLVAGVVLILVGVRLATAPGDHPRQPEPVP